MQKLQTMMSTACSLQKIKEKKKPKTVAWMKCNFSKAQSIESQRHNSSKEKQVETYYTRSKVRITCHQWGSLCHDPAGNRIKQRPPDHRKEMQTEVVWTCLPFIRSGQNHLARHSERRKKTRQTKTTTTTTNQVGIQHQGTYKPGVCQIPEGSGEQRKMEETGCEVIRGAPTTFVVKG